MGIKIKAMKNQFITLILFLLVITACKKSSEFAKISGNVIGEDSMPIANIKIYVVQTLDYVIPRSSYAKDADSIESGWRGVKLIGSPHTEYSWYDSTMTDQNGNFEFSYDLYGKDPYLKIYAKDSGQLYGEFPVDDPTTDITIKDWVINYVGVRPTILKLNIENMNHTDTLTWIKIYGNGIMKEVQNSQGISDTTIFFDVDDVGPFAFHSNINTNVFKVYCSMQDTTGVDFKY